ncbi:hypothetical protein FRB94_008396 [Tulasnella sp. JGI-2019a]|nr:hypothetical protein FRB94_008396 [Tulasnella sp. JGI-2019a]
MSTSKKSADAAIRLASGVTVHTSISYTTHQKKTVKPKMKEDEEDLVVKINSGLTLQVNKGERLWPKDGAKVDKEVGLPIDWGETYQDAVTGV